MTTFLGVDPGGRHTGIVARRGEELLAWEVVTRRDRLTLPDGTYLAAVARGALDVLERAGLGPRDEGLIVVSEDVRYWPQSRKGHTCPACHGRHDPEAGRDRNLTGVLGAAVVHGSILARWADTVVVPAGSGFGSLHESAYPWQLRPAGKGTDRNRHCRSAWDATHHGETVHNQRTRGVAQ